MSAPRRGAAGKQAERPYAQLSDDEVERAYREAWSRRDPQTRELEKEMWRRPGGCGVKLGQDVRGMSVTGIDADRLRIIVELPAGGKKSLTLRQVVNLLSDGRTKTPTEPDKRTPPEPVDYGQHEPVPAKPHPSSLPVEGHPESAEFARLWREQDAEGERMSQIRQETDIVEFERLYWQRIRQNRELAEAVEAAGGLDAANGHWGVRYVLGTPEELRRNEADKRAVYETIKGMRDSGASDDEIIVWLEERYDSPFGGPRPPK